MIPHKSRFIGLYWGNYTIPNYEKQSPFYARSDYPDRQGIEEAAAGRRARVAVDSWVYRGFAADYD